MLFTKNGMVLIMPFFIFLLFVSNVSAASIFQPYEDKIYYSSDNTIVFITVSNEHNLSLHNRYSYTLVDCYDNRNITVYYNDTLIKVKSPKVKALIDSFFVNSTLFTISLKLQNQTLLTINFIAVGGDYIPIRDNDYPPIERWKNKNLPVEPIEETLSINDLAALILLGIALIIINAYLLGLIVKYLKEHKTTEGEYIANTNYYQFYHNRVGKIESKNKKQT